MGEKVRKEKEEERMSNQQLREMLGIESVERMIRKRRLQWVAHSARRGQGDFTWKGAVVTRAQKANTQPTNDKSNTVTTVCKEVGEED